MLPLRRRATFPAFAAEGSHVCMPVRRFIETLQQSIGCDSSSCQVLLIDPATGQEFQRRRLSVDVQAQILFLNETDTSSQIVVSSVQALSNTTQINANLE